MSGSTIPTGITRGFASTPLGQIHYAEAGEGDPPVLFLHETPRSWDQFRDVLPVVGRSRRALAMDTVGFGDSCSPRDDAATIEAYAEGVLLFLDSLGLDQVDLVGHHTGGVIAVEVAAAAPDRISTLVLCSTSLTDEEYRKANEVTGVDEAEQSDDGTHLTSLWSQRHPHYPPEGKADLLDRFIVDAVKSGDHALAGHEACAIYEMESRLDEITAPIHVINGGEDYHANEFGPKLVERVGPVTTQVVEGAYVPMPDGKPDAFAEAVLRALDN
ncbi:MAG: alpha/beta fold hydrolase [Solirubrobacterales bacterium]